MEDLSQKNIKLNREEIARKKVRLESYPITLDATLTSRCNLGCRMCPVYRKKWELPDKTFDEIIRLIPYLKCTTWQGGEAFLYPRFGELLEKIHNNYSYIEQTIYTNALLLDEEWMRKLHGSPKVFFVSVDAPVREVYEGIRVGALFKTLEEKLSLITDFREKSSYPVSIYINAVIMRSNYRLVEEFIRFAKRYSVDKIEFSPVEGDCGPENIFKPRDYEALEYLEKIAPELETAGAEGGIEIFNRLPFKKGLICDKDPSENRSGELFCTLPWTFFFILAGGKVIPHGSCKKFVGDVNTQSIDEIWNSPEMIDYRRRIVSGEMEELCGQRVNWMELI